MSVEFLPHVERMSGYTPGEQPRELSTIKLNTNENPYPPSPRALDAIRKAAGENLRRYPDPLGTAFRETAARLHGVTADMIMPGNGSDDVLTILTRAFVGPGGVVLSPTPSYILYRTLAEIQDARLIEFPFGPDWSIDPSAFTHPEARLAFLANPNSPSGTRLSPEQVGALAKRCACPLVVDEAYADFAETHCLGLIAEFPHVIVTRSFSKGYSLAGLRLGYAVARPEVIAGLVKVKDSYNCDTLSLAGGAAALEDQAHFRANRDRVRATRRRLTDALRSLGFSCPESQANFVWCEGRPDAPAIHQALKDRQILVRLMRYPGLPPGLRITVGTDAEVDRLLEELGKLI
ncbi:MAG: histidinol-phosphate transaminase [Isosphaeraceae bacterium]